jgi:hypothetical protein
LSFACIASVPTGSWAASDEGEIRLVKEVIEKAYIDGIHRKQNMEIAETGFHPDFRMLVLRNGRLAEVDLDKWFSMMGGSRKDMSDKRGPEVTYKFFFVDITDSAAVAKLAVYKDGKLFATDYFSLYKFGDMWKIVSKVFSLGD